MDLEASEPRCRCCCRCRGRPDNDKKTTTTTATKKTSTTTTNRLLVSKCADVFAQPLYLACLFYLACWLSPAGIHVPLADFRLLASCSRLLLVACWVPPPAFPLCIRIGDRLFWFLLTAVQGFEFIASSVRNERDAALQCSSCPDSYKRLKVRHCTNVRSPY